jgi:hypothetical protein
MEVLLEAERAAEKGGGGAGGGGGEAMEVDGEEDPVLRRFAAAKQGAKAKVRHLALSGSAERRQQSFMM